MIGVIQAVCDAVGIAETFVEGETNGFADEDAAEVGMTDRDPRCDGANRQISF